MTESPTLAPPGQPTAIDEWRRNWALVMAAMVGMSFGSLPTMTLGLFMEPLQQEFGWSRAEITLGLTVFALVSLPLTPFAGALVDRYGPRRVAIPGMALSGLCFAAFSLLGGAMVYWLTLWVLYTLASLLIRTLVWNSAVSAAFVASRGLALAILLCGTGIASGGAPIITHWLIENFGWREAYAILGLGWSGVILLLLIPFFHDSRSRPVAPSAAAARSGAMTRPGGLTLREALREPRLIRIAVAVLLHTTLSSAFIVHLIPLLATSGISRAEGAGIAALLGLGSTAGKLVTGSLADRVSSPLLPLSAFGMPVIAYIILLQAGSSVPIAAVAVTVLGYGSGASLHMIAYLTTQYAGLRHFGKIFGIISSMMAFGGGVGPLLAGIIFDETGSYTLLIYSAIGASTLASLAIFRLGAYPVFAPEPIEPVEPAISSAVRPAPAGTL